MAKVYLKLFSASSGCFNVMHIIYFSFVHRMEAVGCWMISACTMLTVSRKWCFKLTVLYVSMEKTLRLCVCLCEWGSLNVSSHISLRLIMISTSWHVLIVYLLKGTKHNATTTINNFLNSDLSDSLIPSQCWYFKSLMTKLWRKTMKTVMCS